MQAVERRRAAAAAAAARTADPAALAERMRELQMVDPRLAQPPLPLKRQRDDDDDAPPAKRPCRSLNHLLILLKECLHKAVKRANPSYVDGAVLGEIGLCNAAVWRCQTSLERVRTLAAFIDRRGSTMTLAALRMHAVTGCPGPGGCHNDVCAWRLTAAERAPVRDAPIAPGDAPSDDAFPLANLPPEIIAHIVRLASYDFSGLLHARATCRGLRRIVDDTLPAILIDLGIIHLQFDCWAYSLDLALTNLDEAPTTLLRGRVCMPSAARLLARPSRTLAALANARGTQFHSRVTGTWAFLLGSLHWGALWDDKFYAIMNPCPTDQRMAYVRQLIIRVHVAESDLGVPLPSYASTEVIERALANITTASYMCTQLEIDLLMFMSDHSTIYPGCKTDAFVLAFKRIAAGHAVFTAEHARALTDRMLDALRAEVAAIYAVAGSRGAVAVLCHYRRLSGPPTAALTEADLEDFGTLAQQRALLAVEEFHDDFACPTSPEDLARLESLVPGSQALLFAALQTPAARILVSGLFQFVNATDDNDRARALMLEFKPVLCVAAQRKSDV